jgi:two-component system cell cycle response regulator
VNAALRTTRARAVLLAGLLLVGGLAAARATMWAGESGRSPFEATFTVAGIGAAVVCALRPALVESRRRAWTMLAAAVGAAVAANCLVGWDALVGLGPLRAVGLGLGISALLLAVRALLLLVEERMGSLTPVAWLDGMTGALVLEAAIALAFLHPVELAVEQQGAWSSIDYIWPAADLLVVGLVAGAAARAGWRLEGWGTILFAVSCFAFGDSLQAAALARDAYLPGGLPELGWLAGAWALAAAAWRPMPPRPDPPPPRGAVPVMFALIALALLTVAALRPDRAYLAMALAGLALVGIIARLAVALGENRKVLLRARREAVTDPLTGLPNRRRLMVDLEREIARSSTSRPAALVLYDMNGFKEYNDTFGHAAGDALLAALGSELAATVGPRGCAYRMGGDEFCVLVARVEGDGSAQAARGAEALAVGSLGFSVSAAHGLVLLPLEATTASDALRLADQRMYEDKAGGRMASGQQVTEALARALLERDPRLGDHVEQVCRLADDVAGRLGLSPGERERVRLAAVLHDIGKIAIPDQLLAKPGPLDEHEWELIRRHTLIGQRILDAAPALRDVAPIVRATHERVDGRGYPDGLGGDRIPMGARIIAVCDAYDAMVSERPYRPTLTPEEALAELARHSGGQFDPVVVAAFRDAVAATPGRAAEAEASALVGDP